MYKMSRLIATVATTVLVASGVAAAQPVTPQASPSPAETPPTVCDLEGGPAQAQNVALQLPDFQAVVSPSDPAERTLTYAGASLKIRPSAVTLPVGIGITPLSPKQIPQLDPGLTNVTGKAKAGFRFTPHPMLFAEVVEVSIPYDPTMLGEEFTPQDIYSYFYDDTATCWRQLQRVRVDEVAQVVVSLTDHFTDMINATVAVPEHPEAVSFNPNQLKGIQAANPSGGIALMSPPTGNNQGDNRMGLNIEVPPGRQGLQPKLAFGYDSSRGNGWMGLGWDMVVPVIAVETRWGVPRYSSTHETETYGLNGGQLTPVAHRSAPQLRAAGDKTFHARVEGDFAKIVRHGTGPAGYTWEVVDKGGTKYLYGIDAESVLTDAAGDGFMWALREVRDLNGNVMRYNYSKVDDPGVDGGTERGTNLYLKSIQYTSYTVTFIRDRELNEQLRADKTIDARGGFKRVTADRLRRVEVSLNGGGLIRRYDFQYTAGAFHKTLLRSIAQQDANGATVGTHTFEYFDDIRDAQGQYQAFQPRSWAVPADGLSQGALNLTSSNGGDASAIGASTSVGGGGHLYVGAGATRSKTNSVGLKVGFSHTEDTGLLALADVDGDGLPDKVFRRDGEVWYRKNLSGPNGSTAFAATAQKLSLPGISSEQSNTLNLGIEGYLGAVAAQLNHMSTFATTSQYFSDVNGDGITDLVTGSTVLFGRIGPGGTPVYGVSGDTPVPITSTALDTGGLFGDFAQERERLVDSFPLLDSVRRWVAPYDGTVRIGGAVRLSPDTTAARAASRTADGVKVAVQREDTELWREAIAAQDNTEHQPQGLDAVAVTRGQRLYFRVMSNFDGSLDEVVWDPTVTYTGVPATLDVNGLDAYGFQASRDFTLGGRSAQVTAPLNGTMRFTGDFRKRAATTDDVTVLIGLDSGSLLSETIPAGTTRTVHVDFTADVRAGQSLKWRVLVDSPIDLDQIEWVPQAHYTAAEGVDRLFDADGNPLINFFPPYDLDMYPDNGLSAPQGSFHVASGGTLTIDPQLGFDFGGATPTARVAFTVKRRGQLLAKRFFDIRAGVVTAPGSFTVAANAGDDLFFDFSTLDTSLRGLLTTQAVTVDGASAPSALHSAAVEGAFAQPYRGWAAIGYNGNRGRADQALTQADLVIDNSFASQLPSTVDPQAQRAAFQADPRINPPKATPFLPSPRLGRWAAGEHTWVSKAAASSSRMGVESIALPRPSDLAGSFAPPRLARSQQISLTGNIGGEIGTIGGSLAFGDSTGEVDFFDLNGDQFPDVVGAGGIQYTDPGGALGATRGSTPDGAVRRSTNISGNVGAGSAARTISTGLGHDSPPGTNTANTAQSGNDMPPLGFGGSHGESSADGEFDLLDINGDQLPDRVYGDGRVALNLGYRFGAAEQWRNPAALNDGDGENNGINIGFNTDFYGFAGGASYTEGNTSSSATLADVNGDGLLDRVFAGSPIRVGLNTGNGFQPPVDFHGSLSTLNRDQNARLGGGAYFVIPICFGIVVACVIINPGFDISTGASRAEFGLRDIDGDGFADHLSSERDDQLVVAQNRTGRTNLLRKVSRPLGATMEFGYARDGNRYDQPGSRFVLTRVAVNDGHPGDGQDVTLTTFEYSNGVFDRLEREFFGYGTVVERQRDAGAAEAVYRSVTREYRTDSHYTRGLMRRETTTDSAGRAFVSVEHTYALHEVGAGVADPRSTTATVFPQLVRTDRHFFEGLANPGKSTFTTNEYDEFGNVTRTFDAGDVGPADDVDARMGYAICPVTYVVGTANLIDVLGGATPMRHREATVDCATGKTTQVRARLAGGQVAPADMEYFANGNLKAVVSPPNKDGQRYRVDYTYDPVVATHVASTTDSFGYRSSATYDLRFGQVQATTDTNNQVLRQSYDALGRIDTITGPYEAAEGRVTIDFEYHPEASVPYAVTRHVDREASGAVRPDTLDTVTFIDGLARVVQTKKDASLHTGPGTAPAASMIISGKVIYDFLGRAVKQHYPTTEGKGAFNTDFNPAVDGVQPTEHTLDVLDRTTRSVFPDNSITTMAYGFGPDRLGALQFEAVATDANGKSKRTYTDVRSLTTAAKEFNPAGGQAVIWTSYRYDALQQMTAITDDRGNVTSTAYDDFGRRTVIDSPDVGRSETAYDLADNVIRKTTAARPQAIEYDYDFNRLRTIRYPVFTGNNVTYTYGAPGAANNGAGRITAMTDGAGIVSREYGQLGELTKETRTSAAQGSHVFTFTTSYRFDTFNRMLSMTYPDGEVLTYHYDSGGNVDSATGAKGEFTYQYLRRLDYDKFDQRVLLDTGNGTRTTYDYDPADRRLNTLQGKLSDGYTFQNLEYEYDNVGNITTVSNDIAVPTSNVVGGPVTQSFQYDDLYQLTHAEGSYQPRGPKTDRYRLDLRYDSIHNITSKAQVHELVGDGSVQTDGKLTYNYSYAYASAKPHAATTIGLYTLGYDGAGNMISRDQQPRPRRQMIWDEENRLACSHENVQSQTLPQTPASCDNAGGTPNAARYFYNDAGTRVIKDSAQFHIYPNQNFSTDGNKQYKHVYIGDTKLITKQVEPEFRVEDRQFYAHADHLGSTGFITDDQGALAEHLNYFPGGESWVSEHPSQPVPQQFTGKEFDPETKLYYFGARYYDPRTQVWQSADPALPDYLKQAPPSINLAVFTYANHNPVRVIDPDGRQAWEELTYERLQEIGRIAILNVPREQLPQYMGLNVYEDAAGRSLAGLAGIRSRATGSSPESRTFGSWLRGLMTLGRYRNVEPDAVAPILGIDRSGQRPPALMIDGAFFEFKAVQGTLSWSTENYQQAGHVDAVAARRLPGYPDSPPMLVYVTTAEISPTLVALANWLGVALYRARMEYDTTSYPRNPLVRVGRLEPMNRHAENDVGLANREGPLGRAVRLFPMPGFQFPPGR